MRRILLLLSVMLVAQVALASTPEEREATRTRNRYELAERFTAGKL